MGHVPEGLEQLVGKGERLLCGMTGMSVEEPYCLDSRRLRLDLGVNHAEELLVVLLVGRFSEEVDGAAFKTVSEGTEDGKGKAAVIAVVNVAESAPWIPALVLDDPGVHAIIANRVIIGVIVGADDFRASLSLQEDPSKI